MLGLVLAFAGILLAPSAWAERVELKNGNVVEGALDSATERDITLEIPGVGLVTIPRDEIAAIHAPAPEVAQAVQPIALAPALAVAPAAAARPTPLDRLVGAAESARGLLGFLVLALMLYYAVCLSLIAEKTETDDAWMAWVPLLHQVLACQIGGRSPWWLVLWLIPVANFLADGVIWSGIARARGRPWWVGLVMLLPVVNLGVLWWLTFRDAPFDPQREAQRGDKPPHPAVFAAALVAGTAFVMASLALVMRAIDRSLDGPFGRSEQAVGSVRRLQLDMAMRNVEVRLLTFGSTPVADPGALAQTLYAELAASVSSVTGSQITYALGEATGPWQVVLIPEPSRRVVRVLGYGESLAAPLVERELPLPESSSDDGSNAPRPSEAGFRLR